MRRVVIIYILTSVTAVVSFVAVLVLKSSLAASPFAIGPHTLALFIPPVAAVGIVSACVWLGSTGARYVLLSFLVLVVSFLPLTSLIREPIVYHKGDDVVRYDTYARNMIENRTVWGGDALLHEGQNHYVDQPGYRYFLAATMVVTGRANRGMQVLHLFLYWITVAVFLTVVSPRLSLTFRRGLALFAFLSSPFAAKAVLLGIGEWVAVVFVLWSITAFVCALYRIAVLLMALVPFFRQNMFVAAGLMVLLFVLISSKKWWVRGVNGILGILVLLLPLWHNIFYADEVRLLVTNTAVPFDYTWKNAGDIVVRILERSLHYLGFSFESGSFSQMIIGTLFAPLGTFLVILSVIHLSGMARIIAVVLVLSVIVPTLILGWAYFPRFEYLNLWFLIASFVMFISFIEKKTESSLILNNA